MFELNDPLALDYTKCPHNTLTGKIIGAAIEVHRTLGPGLLESAYEARLVFELGKKAKRRTAKTITPCVQECKA